MNNYIRQKASIMKRSNFDKEKEFISNLPDDLKGDFLKQSNKKIFKHFYFFKNLT